MKETKKIKVVHIVKVCYHVSCKLKICSHKDNILHVKTVQWVGYTVHRALEQKNVVVIIRVIRFGRSG